jgi:alpha-methylacyl-CoA racemase
MLDTGSHFYEVYETSDGGYMSVGAIEPQFYAEFLDGLGVAGDPDLTNQHDQSRWPEFKERVAEIFRTKSRDEWTQIFQDRDACVFPVLSLFEAPSHPFNATRATHVAAGFDVVQPAPVPRFSRTPGTIQAEPPEPAGNTRNVLREVGYTDEEIEKLAADDAVTVPDVT